MEQWRKDQEEKERTKKEEAQNHTRRTRMQNELHRIGIPMNQVNEIIDRCGIDHVERMLKKTKSKNPKNPAGLLKHIIKNY
jgi:hypothetical protein